MSKRPPFQPRTFRLVGTDQRARLIALVENLPLDAAKPLEVVIREEKKARTLDQNAILHAIFDEVSKSGITWMGKERTPQEWKVLFISGHAVATKIGAEIIPGLENEFVNIRESSASMSASRFASLVDYVLAWCADNAIMLPYIERGDKCQDTARKT